MEARAHYSNNGDITLSTPYNEKYVERIRTIPSRFRSYSPPTRSWLIRSWYADVAERIAREFFPNLIVEGKTRQIKHRESKIVESNPEPDKALAICIAPVLQRDNHTCQYCNAPAAHIDQYTNGSPNMDTLVSTCLSCLVIGRGVFFDSVSEKAEWIKSQD